MEGTRCPWTHIGASPPSDCEVPVSHSMLSRDAIRQRALYAAASVVLASGITACHTPTPTESTDDPLDSDDKLSVTDSDLDMYEDAQVDTDTTFEDSDVTPGLDTSVTTSDTDSQDTDPADTDSQDTDTTSGAPDCLQVAPEDVGICCAERELWCASQHPQGGDGYYECQFGPDFDGSTGCVPWGPPAPPAMGVV